MKRNPWQQVVASLEAEGIEIVLGMPGNAWNLQELPANVAAANEAAQASLGEAEIDVVRPLAIVCLGATAAQALLGPQFRVTKQRGEFVESPLAPLAQSGRR
jgi:uracil-DNA glycosylase